MTATIEVTQRMNIPQIIREYASRLQGFIRKRVRSTEDAEDVLQEVFFQLAEADRMMKPVDQVAAWLFTVARNRITDLYRKKKTAYLAESAFDEEDEYAEAELGALLFDKDNNPETEYLRSLVWSELDKALEEMPPKQREVFEMNELQGIPFKEISQKTGEPVNTLISRKRYAVLFLRQRLQLLYDDLINF